MTFPSIGLEAGEPFLGGFPTGGKHLLPCEVPGGHCRGPRKAAPGCSRARTPGRNNVKACREPQNREMPLGLLADSGCPKAPDPACLAPACRGRGAGNPVSAQPPSWVTPGAHLRAPLSLARGKTLASPALGFQPSPGTASAPRQHTSTPREGRAPVCVWLKKKKKVFHVGSTGGRVNREPGDTASARGSSSPSLKPASWRISDSPQPLLFHC